jgi:hypothetical protein
MISYELLELLEFMDDEGAFKTAYRGGEYSEKELTRRRTHNEIALLRSSFHAVHGGQRYEPQLLLSKAQQEAEAESTEAAAERREEFFSFATRELEAVE